MKFCIHSEKLENVKLNTSLETAKQQYSDQITDLENQKHHINELMESNKNLSEKLSENLSEHSTCKSKILALTLENQKMLSEYRK